MTPRLRPTPVTLALATVFASACAAHAAPVQWKVEDGGNGHFYDFIAYPVFQSISWDTARDHAATQSYGGARGHLTTITSAAEQAFFASLPRQTNWVYYLGASQDFTATKSDEGWSWVTGEPWAFTAWGPNEPNDRSVFVENGVEQYLMMFAGKNPPDFGVRGMWNDESNVPFGPIGGYLVEYDLPEPHPAALLAGAMALPLLRRRRAARSAG